MKYRTIKSWPGHRNRCVSLLFLIMLCSQSTLPAQQNVPTLKRFFEQRLADRSDASPPANEALLNVIDTIAASHPQEIEPVLPLLSSALLSDIPNLPAEAMFALYAIARRPDGGSLLRNRVPEIGSLLASSDDRLSGGAVLTLRSLTPAIPEVTRSIMISHLTTSAKPSVVKSDIIRALLASRPDDIETLKAIERYLTQEAGPRVAIANLQAVAGNYVLTPEIIAFAIRAFRDRNKHVVLSIRRRGAVSGTRNGCISERLVRT